MDEIRRPITFFVTARQKLAMEILLGREGKSVSGELRPLIMPRIEELERRYLAEQLEKLGPE